MGQNAVAHVAQVGFLGINPGLSTSHHASSGRCTARHGSASRWSRTAPASARTRVASLGKKRVCPELVHRVTPTDWATAGNGMPYVSSVSIRSARLKRLTRAHLTRTRPRQEGNVGECWSGNSGKSNSVVNGDKLVVVAYAAAGVRAFHTFASLGPFTSPLSPLSPVIHSLRCRCKLSRTFGSCFRAPTLVALVSTAESSVVM